MFILLRLLYYINFVFMSLRKIFIFALIFLSSGVLFSQNTENAFKKFHLLRMEGELEKAYRMISNLEKNAITHNPEMLPRIYLEFTKYHFSADNFDEAKKYADRSFKLGQESSNSTSKAYGLFAQAYYYYQLNLDETATQYSKQVVSIIEKDKHADYALSEDAYYLLYRISSHFDDPKMTNDYADKSMNIALKSKNYELLANAYAAKANAMEVNYKKTNIKYFKDSIKIYLEKSMELYNLHSKEIAQRTYAITNINLADIYFKEYQQDNSPEAKEKIFKYLNNVDKLNKMADFNYELRANVLGIRSQLALNNRQYDQAEFYLKSALSHLTQESKRPAYYTLFNVVSALEEFYKDKNDYKNALYYADQKLEYERKMFDQSSAANVRTLEAKYENLKIADELKISKNKNYQQKRQNYMLIAILLLLCTTIYFISRNFKTRIQLQKKRAENLEKEKLKTLAELNLENEARKSIAAEQKILKLEHDKVQKEALVHTLLLDQKNQLLKEIDDQLKNTGDVKVLRKALKQDAKSELKVNDKAQEFEELDPIFFVKMQQICGNKLTARDIKICAYLYLGFGNKELSEILNVEPKTIRMSKYRIKKKLELDVDIQLEDEIKRIMSDL